MLRHQPPASLRDRDRQRWIRQPVRPSADSTQEWREPVSGLRQQAGQPARPRLRITFNTVYTILVVLLGAAIIYLFFFYGGH